MQSANVCFVRKAKIQAKIVNRIVCLRPASQFSKFLTLFTGPLATKALYCFALKRSSKVLQNLYFQLYRQRKKISSVFHDDLFGTFGKVRKGVPS